MLSFRPITIVVPRAKSKSHANDRSKTRGWVVLAARGSGDGSSDEPSRDYEQLRNSLSRRWMERDVGSGKVSWEDAVKDGGVGHSCQDRGGDDPCLEERMKRRSGDGDRNSDHSRAWTSLAAQTLVGLDSAILKQNREGGGEPNGDASGGSREERDSRMGYGSEGGAEVATAAGGRAWLSEMAKTRRDGTQEREELNRGLQPEADSSTRAGGTTAEEVNDRHRDSGSSSSSTDPSGREAPPLPSLELSRYASACVALRREARELGIPEAVLPAVPGVGSAECTVEGLAALRDHLLGMIESRLSSNL